MREGVGRGGGGSEVRCDCFPDDGEFGVWGGGADADITGGIDAHTFIRDCVSRSKETYVST